MAGTMGTEACIFDLDGLLVDSEPHKFKAWRAALRAHGSELTMEEFADEWVNKGFSSRSIVEKHGLQDVTPEALRDEVSKVYLKAIDEELTLMPGARELLDPLEGAGVRMALGTSSYHVYVERILERFCLARCFEVVVTQSDVKNVKPEPDIFIECARRLKVHPRKCLVFEDAVKGLIAAHRAGMRVVCVPTEFTKGGDFSEADLVLDSLEEFRIGMLG